MKIQKGFSTLWGIIILLVIGAGAYWFINDEIQTEKIQQDKIVQDEIEVSSSTSEIKNVTTKTTGNTEIKTGLNFNQKLETILELTPYLAGANFICNSENNCPNVLNAIKTQTYSSCDSLGVYVFDHLEESPDGRQVIVTRLEQNPEDKNDKKDLGEYKELCKTTIAIIKSDTQYELNENQLAGLYSLNNDITSCSTLDTYKESCLQNIALIFGDEKICRETENTDNCYKNIATNKNDESYCENINSRNSKRACYVNIALKKNDYSLCNIVPYTQEEFDKLTAGPVYDYSNEVTQCYIKIAQSLKQPEICEQIDDFDRSIGDMTIVEDCKSWALE